MSGLLDKLFRRPIPEPARPSTAAPAAAPAARPSTAPSPAAIVPEGLRRASQGPGLVEFFTQDHRHCDEGWAEVESAAQAGGAALQAAWTEFEHRMLRHLSWEEDVLFPAFETSTGMSGMGPTVIMRSEHDQMRKVLVAMADAVERGETEALLDLGDTLMMLIQQHNVKEEGMLYPMSEHHLMAQWPELRELLT